MQTSTKIGLALLALLCFLFPKLSNAEIRLLLVFPKQDETACSAIIKGARDLAAEQKRVYGLDIAFKIERADTEEEIAGALESGYMKGFAGAIIFPQNPVAETLSSSIKHLQERKFLIAATGMHAEKSGAFALVMNDDASAVEIARSSIYPFEKAVGFKVFCLLEEEKKDWDKSALGEEAVKKITALYPNATTLEIGQYSLYAQQNKDMIRRLDNYALVFLSPKPLANAALFEKSPGRLFAICFGAVPQMGNILKSGGLNACYTPDYYGFGYVSARTLAERISGRTPKETSVILPLKRYDKTNADAFISEWNSYMSSPWQ